MSIIWIRNYCTRLRISGKDLPKEKLSLSHELFLDCIALRASSMAAFMISSARPVVWIISLDNFEIVKGHARSIAFWDIPFSCLHWEILP